MGTADYMSPEQARGADVDGRADAYALGCVLYKSLTGVVPFDRGSDLEKMWAHLNDEPPSLLEARPELPRALDEVVRRAMAKDRDDRYATAGEFGRAALAAVEGGAAAAPSCPAPDAMRVVVAEDSVLLRAGVVHLLEAAGFDVVAQAGDAEELMREVRAHRPDVAVTDIRMPPTHTDEGLRAARTIRAELPGTGVLVLSQYAEEAYAVDLLRRERARASDTCSRTASRIRAASPTPCARSGRAAPRSTRRSSRRCSAGRASPSPLERALAAPARRARADGRRALQQRDRRGARVSERAVERDIGAIFAKLDLPPGNEGHRRVLAVLRYLRGA